jgi:hypothetical protein
MTLNPYMVWIKVGAAALLLSVLGWVAHSAYTWAYTNGYNAANVRAEKVIGQFAQAEADAQAKARAAEAKSAGENARIADAYEKGKQDAEAAGKRVADDLRAGNLKLRNRWQGCQATDRVSDAATRAAESDAEAADRAESAGRIVRAAREADEQIKGLQDILRAERR